MKPLTIDELKALQVGDWVWVEYDEYCIEGCYVRICAVNDKQLITSHTLPANAYDFSDYGKTWLAYKNKEQAEANGEIVELQEPTIRPWNATKESGFSISFPRIVEDVEYYKTEEEAEHRLAELKGEKV